MKKCWKIPPGESSVFAAKMEDVLCVYQLPHDAAYPQICMDESCKQLVGKVRIPIPAKPGYPLRYDDEYIRKGVAEIFMFVEPLRGWRHVEATQRRTKMDWAHQIKNLVDVHYPKAKKTRLVMDNLNTHSISSLYKTFPAVEAKRLAEKLEIHFTPKHGSWLNMAEIEFSALSRQCLDRRIDNCDPPRPCQEPAKKIFIHRIHFRLVNGSQTGTFWWPLVSPISPRWAGPISALSSGHKWLSAGKQHGPAKGPCLRYFRTWGTKLLLDTP